MPSARTRGSGSHRVAGAALALSCVSLLAGCGGKQSSLAPHSDQSRQIMHLWWGMLAAAAVVFFGALLLIGLAWARRRPGWPLVGHQEGFSRGLVVTFGIAIPVISLSILFGISNTGVIRKTSAPSPSSTAMTIDVIGHQWFWEVRYPGSAAVTANEIHIPVNTRVNVVATTSDVIHSFWVPELNRKIDMIPGQENRVLLYGDKVGEYRGQCAEFCGFQHAHMAFAVFVDTPTAFRAWLANMAANRPAPTTPAERSGEEVFLTSQCASCHSIRGTAAVGRIGPDLTHLASRTTLAALTIPNRPGYLGGWILDPQHIKPGNKMPGLNLTGPQLQALLAYLGSLR